jgi:hypothetical protein
LPDWRHVFVTGERLRRAAPSAVEQGSRSRDLGHLAFAFTGDADQRADGERRMLPRKFANLG